eukprot:g22656.t1
MMTLLELDVSVWCCVAAEIVVRVRMSGRRHEKSCNVLIKVSETSKLEGGTSLESLDRANSASLLLTWKISIIWCRYQNCQNIHTDNLLALLFAPIEKSC